MIKTTMQEAPKALNDQAVKAPDLEVGIILGS